MVRNVLFISLFLCFCSCADTGVKKETTQPIKSDPAPIVSAPIVGGDRDKHDCITSAGYQWSVLKNDCIRIFESGIRLNAVAPNLDKTFSAFAVFKSENDKAQAELFIVGVKNAPILTRVSKDDSNIWKNDAYTLTQNKDTYSLEDSKKTLLYQGQGKAK